MPGASLETVPISGSTAPSILLSLRGDVSICERVLRGVAWVLQVEEKFRTVVQPFLKSNARLGLPHDAASTHSLYLWATAMVSAYSFTIGDDR